MAKLLYQGHGSYRITSNDKTVIYVDPYVGAGYETPADIILVTHQHGDHNQIGLVTQKPGCEIITNEEAITLNTNGMPRYNSFTIGSIKIEAVEASNSNHSPDKCVGYIIYADDIKIYASGDTSMTAQMKTFPGIKLDYALLPCDGVYNMDVKEASVCAEIIGARHNIPVHMKPGELFDRKIAESFTGPNRLIVEPGEEIELT